MKSFKRLLTTVIICTLLIGTATGFVVNATEISQGNETAGSFDIFADDLNPERN